MFERLREAIEAALDAATPAPSSREVASGMREAIIEARAALQGLRERVAKTERELAVERKHLEDAERRGRLATGIDDQETVEVAERFATKHRERVSVQERKLEAQRAELALAEREIAEMTAQLKGASRSPNLESAWRELEGAGGTRPETDVRDELLRSELDKAAREARAETQLAELKKRMGK